MVGSLGAPPAVAVAGQERVRAVLEALPGGVVGAVIVVMLVMFLLGFVPGYILALILKIVGLLRCTEEAEIAGLDLTKVPAKAYPEGISASATPAE